MTTATTSRTETAFRETPGKVTWAWVKGGEVRREVEASGYGASYTVDVATHPAFSPAFAARLLKSWNRKDGTLVICGGCLSWTAEQFIENLLNHFGLADAFVAVLEEDDNFVRQTLGLKKGQKVRVR